MKYAFILKKSDQIPVAQTCRILKVSRSGYYSWRKKYESKSKHQLELISTIEKVFIGSRGVYDSPRIYRRQRLHSSLGY